MYSPTVYTAVWYVCTHKSWTDLFWWTQCLFMTRKKKHIKLLTSLYHWLFIAFHNTFQPEHSELILYISKW